MLCICLFELNISLSYEQMTTFSPQLSLVLMTSPVATQRGTRAAGPGEGPETRCCSGRVATAVEETRTEAPWGGSLKKYQSLLAGCAQSGCSICGLERDRSCEALKPCRDLCFFKMVQSSLLTFINLPHVSEVGIQLCRWSIILSFIWNDPLWGLRDDKRFRHRESKMWSQTAVKVVTLKKRAADAVNHSYCYNKHWQ